MAIFVRLPKGYHSIKMGDVILAGPLIFKVLERDVQGRPSVLQIGYDDTKFILAGNEQFYKGAIEAKALEIETDEIPEG